MAINARSPSARSEGATGSKCDALKCLQDAEASGAGHPGNGSNGSLKFTRHISDNDSRDESHARRKVEFGQKTSTREIARRICVSFGNWRSPSNTRLNDTLYSTLTQYHSSYQGRVGKRESEREGRTEDSERK